MSKYDAQRFANILAFHTAEEYSARRELLVELASALEKNKVTWALACSSSLFFMGLVDDFHDYDIVILPDDVENFKKTATEIGIELLKTEQKAWFCSRYYQEARRGNVSFDLISEFSFCTYHCLYRYRLKKEDIVYITLDNGINIPIVPAEASLIHYGMMEGWQAKRRFKRILCEEYLKDSALQHRDILEDALQQGLPDFLQKVVVTFL